MSNTNGASTGTALAPLQACGWDRLGIERFAEKVRAHFELRSGEDLERAVELLGGQLVRRPWPELDPSAGTLRVEARNQFSIQLPADASPKRNAFTIAHELGHYFLHSNQGQRPGLARRSLMSDRAEWEANWFAAALLMPADEFLAAVDSATTLTEVAERFGVSIDAADVRRRSLADRGE